MLDCNTKSTSYVENADLSARLQNEEKGDTKYFKNQWVHSAA